MRPIGQGVQIVSKFIQVGDVLQIEALAGDRFVAETARMTGGGTGHGSHDVYPDAWHVAARKLNADGSYNPNGTLLQFVQDGTPGSSSFNSTRKAKVVGKMQMTFVPITAQS